MTPGTVESCARTLKDGHLLSIAPGGVFEAQFGDNTYKLLWGKRIGFAKVAIQGQAVSTIYPFWDGPGIYSYIVISIYFKSGFSQPIIPIFTQNLREAFRTVSVGRSQFLKLFLFNMLQTPAFPETEYFYNY